MRRVGNGFTLVELLVSATLLALVSASVTGVMSVCLSAWRAGQERSDLAQEAEAVLDTVGQDLRAAFIGRRGFFIADAAGNLELTTLSRRMDRVLYLGTESGENASDLAQAIYFTQARADDDTLVLYRREICPPEREPLGETALDAESAQMLCAGVVSFSLRFWDGQEWVTEWDAPGASTAEVAGTPLPGAAEIVLALREGRRQQVCVTRVPICMSAATVGGAQ